MFIKNKIMVSLKKYIIKWLKILQTPIVKEFPFFLLFLLAITIMPIRFIPSHVHYFFMNISLKGIESISRGSIIGGFFSLISLILIMFCVPYTDMSMFTDRESTLKITDGLNLLFVFAPLVVSFAFNKNYKGKKLRANLLPFAIVSFVIALLMCFVKLLNISEYSYPLYTLSKISFKMIPMGLSGLFLVLSLICIFFGILYFNLAVKNIMDNHSKVMSLIFIFAVMIVSVLTIALPDVGKIILNNYFLLSLYLIITLLTPIFATIKEEENYGK